MRREGALPMLRRDGEGAEPEEAKAGAAADGNDVTRQAAVGPDGHVTIVVNPEQAPRRQPHPVQAEGCNADARVIVAEIQLLDQEWSARLRDQHVGSPLATHERVGDLQKVLLCEWTG